MVFVPTGSASPDYYGGERVGDGAGHGNPELRRSIRRLDRDRDGAAGYVSVARRHVEGGDLRLGEVLREVDDPRVRRSVSSLLDPL